MYVNITILDRFQALTCSSSGGQIVLSQYESALNRHTVQPFTESDDIRCCVLEGITFVMMLLVYFKLVLMPYMFYDCILFWVKTLAG
jgi:hypothetical protein